MTMSEILKQLLRKFPKHEVSFIFFTDKMIFTIVPHEHKNDRVYTTVNARKQDISVCVCVCPHPAFSHSVTVLVAASN